MPRAITSLFLLSCPLWSAVALAESPELEPPPALAPAHEGTISGVVKHEVSGEPIDNALVILQCSCLEDPLETMTNARGIYSFRELPPGAYTVQVLAGKANVSKMTELPRDAKFRANFSLDPMQDMVIEIVVEASPVASSAPTAVTIGMDEARHLPVGSSSSRDFTAVVDISPSASRDAAGIRLAGTTGAEQVRTRAGTLTVGTLDDAADERELVEFARGSFPNNELAQLVGGGQRMEIEVVDARGEPVADAQVLAQRVGDPQRRLAQLRTGSDGRAVLNTGLDLGGLDRSERRAKLEIWALSSAGSGREVRAQIEVRADEDHARVRLPLRQRTRGPRVTSLDLLLIVDTTGSMGDELAWLQAELREVVAQTLAAHPGVDVRLGLVAYRDEGDDYVTRSFPFSTDHAAFQASLAAESAGGGGDYPEAVDTALQEASRFAWRSDPGVAKVALLVGDAPPHDRQLDETFAAGNALRRAGVSIYPVASSGVEDFAELVFRSLAADSSGQYLFLTDDSGIGLSHAKPHADDYSVELLYDALLRVLAAELAGERSVKPRRPKRAAFGLSSSLMGDGGASMLLGGPQVRFDLM